MAENKLFVNPKTGQMSATKSADFNQDLDTYTPAQPSSPAPTTAPVAPATPPPAITTKDIITPPAGVATAANKRGTFASYDPITGLASNRRALDIGQQGMNDYLETAINGVEYSKNPDQFVITSKNANTLYGFKKPPKQETATTQTAQANAPAQPADPYPDMKKTGNPYMDSLINNSNQYGDEIVRKLAENEDLDTEIDTQNEVVSAINAKKLKMEADLDLENINQSISSMALKEEYYTGKDTIKGNARQMLGDVSSKLTELSSRINEAFDKKAVQEAVTNATNLYQYHLVQNDYNVATGKLQQLEQDSRENADMIFKYQTAMNDISANLFNMDRQTKELKQKEIDREYEMAMQGYSYVPNPAALQELAKKKGTDWVEANTTKIGGKIWIKPDTSKEIAFTHTINGNLVGYNAQGDMVKNFGNVSTYDFTTMDDGSTIVTNKDTGEVSYRDVPKNASTLMGNATITGANGSSVWANGLDMVVNGGYGAEIISPFSGTVIETKKSDTGFGNQVKLKLDNGDEAWFSHLNSFGVKQGDRISKGAVIGTQGNSGTVTDMSGNRYNAEQKKSGKGTHLDLTMKRADGSYYSPQEVLSKISPQQAQPQAVSKTTGGYFDKETGEKPKLTATQIDTLSGFDSTLAGAERALNMFVGENGEFLVNTGPIVSKLHEARKFMGNPDTGLLELEQLTAKIKADFMKSLSGSTVTEQEVKRLSKLLPDINDTEAVLKTKLEMLIKETESQKTIYKNTLGIDQEQVYQGTGKINEALKNGYSPNEILEYMADDDNDVAARIDEARKEGYSDEEILNFLNK